MHPNLHYIISTISPYNRPSFNSRPDVPTPPRHTPPHRALPHCTAHLTTARPSTNQPIMKLATPVLVLLLCTLVQSQTDESIEEIQMDICSTIYGDTLATKIFWEQDSLPLNSARTAESDQASSATPLEQPPTPTPIQPMPVSPERCSVMRLIDDLKCVCFLAGRGQFNVPMPNMFRRNCRVGFMVRRLSQLRPFCNRYRRGPKRIIRPRLVRRAVTKSPIICEPFFNPRESPEPTESPSV